MDDSGLIDIMIVDDGQIGFLKMKLETAPDIYKPAGDYSEGLFLGVEMEWSMF